LFGVVAATRITLPLAKESGDLSQPLRGSLCFGLSSIIKKGDEVSD
jgi:hypothetical protein